MDAWHFKAAHFRRTDIWRQADELRQRLLPQNTLPVPVLDLAEFDLGLDEATVNEPYCAMRVF